MTGESENGRRSLTLLVCLTVVLVSLVTCAHAQNLPPPDQADLFLDFRAKSITLSLPDAPEITKDLQPAIERAIGAPVHSVRTSENGGWTFFARSPGAFRWKGLMAEAIVRPAPIIAWLRKRDYRRMTVTFVAQHTPVAHAGPGSINVSSLEWHDFYYPLILVRERPIPEQVTFEYGYRIQDLFAPALAVVLPPLLAVLLALLARRTILQASVEDATAGWFAYARRVGHISLGMWLLTFCGFLATNGVQAIGFIGGQGRDELGWPISAAAMLVPAWLGRPAIAAISFPVIARVRGVTWTRADIVMQTFWSIALLLVPLLFSMIGFGALLDSEPRRGVAWLFAAMVGLRLCHAQLRRTTQLSPEAVTTGELRDRIFGLAEKAGVKLNQIYLFAAGKGKLANAFAMSNNNVIVTDYLLEHMSKREIDAIMGHELARLKHKHPVQLARVFLLTLAIPMVALLFYSAARDFSHIHGPDLTGTAFLLPLSFPIALLAMSFVSRRFERVADSGAVELAGDPEALISALAKLSRLNHIPTSWGRWTQGTVTHPATAARAQAIASHAGIAPNRVQELLDETSSDPERYALQVPAQGRVYSTMLRIQLQSRLSLQLTVATLLPIAACAAAAQYLHLSGAALVMAWIAGVLGAIGCNVAVLNFGAVQGLARVRRALAARLADEGYPQAGNGQFVQFSPGSETRAYDGATNWDAGFLIVAPGYVAYIGENVRFVLPANQITAARLQTGWPGWLPSPRVRIVWGDPESQLHGEFQIASADGPTVLSNSVRTEHLASTVDDHFNAHGSTAPIPPPLTDLGPPSIGSVTGLTVKESVRPGVVIRSVFAAAVYALCLSIVIGLEYLPDRGGAALYTIGAAIAMGLLQWFPISGAARWNAFTDKSQRC